MNMEQWLGLGLLVGCGYVAWFWTQHGRYPWQPEPALVRVRPRKIITANMLKPKTISGYDAKYKTLGPVERNLGSYIVTKTK